MDPNTQSVCSKIKNKYTLKSFLEFPELERVLIYKDYNSMKREYYKVLAWFHEDLHSYFEIFDWTSDFNPLETWIDNDILFVENKKFKCHKVESSLNIWELTSLD